MLSEDLKLRSAQPNDRPHLLVWDTLNDRELRELVYRENAECISYRTHLLSRIDRSQSFLTLHLWLERELDAIKSICDRTDKPVVLLQDLDCLITYLCVQPKSPITVFWQNLFHTRHLSCVLWIILPSQLVPPDWDDKRMKHIIP